MLYYIFHTTWITKLYPQ